MPVRLPAKNLSAAVTSAVSTIVRMIHSYDTQRVQRNLGLLTPMEKHVLVWAHKEWAAASAAAHSAEFLYFFLRLLDGGRFKSSPGLYFFKERFAYSSPLNLR